MPVNAHSDRYICIILHFTLQKTWWAFTGMWAFTCKMPNYISRVVTLVKDKFIPMANLIFLTIAAESFLYNKVIYFWSSYMEAGSVSCES